MAIMIEELNNYIEKNFSSYKLDYDGLICTRMDGHIVYDRSQDKVKSQSLGALISGLWHAANNILSIKGKEESDVFRLSFDSSERGIYILPLKLSEEELILGYLFEDEINPGLMKSNFRGFRDFLELQAYSREGAKKGEDLLFENLSDEEMDNIFSAIRN